ncbi:MAG: AAA family ATPase [Clostridia bacterium]|nr:AAA family ATPase [Clostridia bacterium]
MKNKRWQGLMVLGMIGALLIFLLAREAGDAPARLSYPEFWQLAEHGKIESVTLGSGDTWQVQFTDGTRAATPNPRATDGKERLLALGIDVREQGEPMPALLLAALALGGALLLLRGGGRGAAGLQKYAAVHADERVPDVTLSDVAISADTMQSMRDLASFLKHPESFIRLGARRPRGVMLYGPPGTGKTLLARALAGEAKTAFFALSGSDFVQVYVGVGASRVRELFRRARKAGGGVIFIDEIDAIGKSRDNGNDERDQTLNALLTEMSGFSGQDGIIVLAATNRLDTLDAALLREGRFDRRIEVGLPDYGERLKILQVHARNKPLAETVKLQDLARRTTLFSGAQLETLLNEAAIRAARREGMQIEPEDMEAAFCAVTVGEERPGKLSEREKRTVAWHEAGHALLTHVMQPEAQLARVTIIPSSRGAAGYSMSVQPDRQLRTRKELMAMISVALGGRAAEEMLLGQDDVTTGAANDLKRAREIASAMAREWAMGKTGDPAADEKDILREAMETARQCLQRYESALQGLAQALLTRETLLEEELRPLLAGIAPEDAAPEA